MDEITSNSQVIKPKLQFRCFSCWTLLGYIGIKDQMICPKCDAELYVGYLENGIIIGSGKNSVEYGRLLQKIHDECSNNRDLYKGEVEVIADSITRHRPDAIYYYNDEKHERQPLIYEVETCILINDPNTISKCRLFSETARNLAGKFHLIVPKNCDDKDGKKIAEAMLKQNKIEKVEITAY